MELLLWILVSVSLLMNFAVLIYGLRIRQQVSLLRFSVRNLLKQALNDLDRVENMALHFQIQVKDNVPVRDEVPVKEKMDVAVKGMVPIKQDIDTIVSLKSPIFGAKVSVDVTVPLELNVPIELNVPVVIDYRVPVQLDIPVHLDVPVNVELGKTEFGDFIRQVRGSLQELDKLI